MTATPRSIDILLPDVMTFAPSAPEPMAYRYIREAAREMAHNVKLWREWVTVTAVAGAENGIVTLPDSDIVEIQTATINGHKLSPVTVEYLDSYHPGWDIETSLGTGRYVTQTNPRLFSIWPRESGQVRLRLLLQPNRTCLTLPSVLVDKYGEVVVRGAAGLLLLAPSDFANPTLGAGLVAEFQSRLSTLKVEHTKGQQGARLRTTGVWF
jgi:hypothetical protein